ncbi:MAG: penicillin-binding protein 2 [Candidatus Brocadiales bacterium]|nr:penicillin-binding protein 2 [Candidatus Bathyanammoxibius amoris]
MRSYIFIIALFVIYSVLAFQLGRIQLVEHDKYQKLADRQHYKRVEIPALRGAILDRNGKILAHSIETNSIYADPKEIEDKPHTSRELANALDLDVSRVQKALDRDKRFAWIKRQVSKKEAQAVEELALAGVSIQKESRRSYPCGKLLCHILGFVDIDESGLEGVEFTFNTELSGRPGYKVITRDGLQRAIFSAENPYASPVNGDNLVLTVDITIQHILEEELDKAFEKWKPVSATVIAMDPATGEILALSNRPTFDPNLFTISSADQRRNRAITDSYEPGSIMKPLVVSGILQRRLVSPKDVIFCSNGVYKIGRRTLRDVHSYGNLTVEEIVIHSSNIGMSKLAAKNSIRGLYEDLRGFGLGRPTGIRLPGEVGGILRHYKNWTSYSTASVAMGYEVAVTPLQMITAYCTIANGGTLLRPRTVKAVVDGDGRIKKRFGPESRGRMLDSELANGVMTPILTRVIDEGTGRRAAIKGHKVAGKTGTSKKIKQGGKGYRDTGYISSFIGYAPAEEPKICVLVMVNEPHGRAYYGGTVAAPVVKEILRRSLNYMKSTVSQVEGSDVGKKLI